MNLSRDRFFHHAKRAFRGSDGITREFPVYGYESQNDLLEIVDLADLGGLLVRKNSGRWSPLICDWQPIHYKIKDHFEL